MTQGKTVCQCGRDDMHSTKDCWTIESRIAALDELAKQAQELDMGYDTPEDKEDYESPYCGVCESCGEEGCCSVEKSILGHGCKYAQWYAKDVYFNEVLINELLKLLKSMGVCRDETGDVVKDPIGDVYDRAFKRVKEKYGK